MKVMKRVDGGTIAVFRAEETEELLELVRIAEETALAELGLFDRTEIEGKAER